MFSVIGGIFSWRQLHLLVGIGGESMGESVVAELAAADGISAPILQFVPFIVADGLLVRLLCHAFDLFLHDIDMAVL